MAVVVLAAFYRLQGIPVSLSSHSLRLKIVILSCILYEMVSYNEEVSLSPINPVIILVILIYLLSLLCHQCLEDFAFISFVVDDRHASPDPRSHWAYALGSSLRKGALEWALRIFSPDFLIDAYLYFDLFP